MPSSTSLTRQAPSSDALLLRPSLDLIEHNEGQNRHTEVIESLLTASNQGYLWLGSCSRVSAVLYRDRREHDDVTGLDGSWVQGNERQNRLNKLMSKYLLRRRKDTVISEQLPKKIDSIVFCQLTELQVRAYK